MGKSIVFTLFFLVTAWCAANEFKASLDVAYTTELLDKGESFYRDEDALLTNLGLSYGDFPARFEIGHRQAVSDSISERHRLDYAIGTGRTSFEEQPYQVSYGFTYIYHDFYNADNSNGHEYVLGLSLDELIPGGLVPRYTFVYETPDGQPGASGFYHVFGLGYGIPVAGVSLGPEGEELSVDLSAEIAYRDGLGGDAVPNDWSHALFAISSTIEVFEGINLTPAFQYQLSIEEAVNNEDRTAFTLHLSGSY